MDYAASILSNPAGSRELNRQGVVRPSVQAVGATKKQATRLKAEGKPVDMYGLRRIELDKNTTIICNAISRSGKT